jgi:hypothetical protein
MEACGGERDIIFSSLQIMRLSMVLDPILLLYLSSASDNLWGYPPSLKTAIETRDGEELKRAIEHWCDSKIWKSDINIAELVLLRSVLARWTGSITPKVIARLARIETIDGEPMVSMYTNTVKSTKTMCLQLAKDWHSLLHQPILGRIIKPDNRLDLDSKVRILKRVCGYEWFFKEFTAAHGFSWLIEKVENWMLERMVTIICGALELTSEPREVNQWITCLHQMLSSVQNPGDTRRETLRRPERFITLINDRKYKVEDRMKEEIISGLHKGFIAVTPIAHFVRDPDGMPSCTGSL